MPIKYRRSQKKRNKNTAKISVEHFYIKAVSTEKLNEMLVNENTPKKLKQKIKNQIVKRNKTGL